MCGRSDLRTESDCLKRQTGCCRGLTIHWASGSLATYAGFSRCQSCSGCMLFCEWPFSSRLAAFAVLLCFGSHHPLLSDLYTLGIPCPGRSCLLQSTILPSFLRSNEFQPRYSACTAIYALGIFSALSNLNRELHGTASGSSRFLPRATATSTRHPRYQSVCPHTTPSIIHAENDEA